MFYLVSKIAWFFVTPSNLLTTLTIAGLVLMWLGRATVGFRLAAGASAALLLAGLSPLGNALILPLESRFAAASPPAVTGIIVLGGTYDSEVTNQRGQMALNESGERILALGDLARRYPQARIIYSGGGSSFTPDTTPEATLVERTAPALGLDPARIEYERASLNTYENAAFSKVMARPQADETWLLVTSAFHMPRSMGVFRQVGFDVLPYPVDYRTAGTNSLLRPFGFVGEGLRRTDIAAKEWIGLVAYYLTGKTDSLLPAPQTPAGQRRAR